jgi:predicted DNA-binding transcriptional regulator AlpA
MDKPVRYVRMTDLAKRYNVSVYTIERWVRDKNYPRPMKISRIRLFRLDEVEAFEASNRAEGEDT